MNQYLLSTYRVEGEVPGHPETPEEMQAFMQGVIALEAEMEDAGAFVFGGALRPAEASTVDQSGSTSNGPFASSDAELAGFYIINAGDLDEAKVWAKKTAEATNHPIELRPFMATGRVKDQMP